MDLEHFKKLTLNWLKDAIEIENLFSDLMEKLPADKLEQFLKFGAFGAIMIGEINPQKISYYQSIKVINWFSTIEGMMSINYVDFFKWMDSDRLLQSFEITQDLKKSLEILKKEWMNQHGSSQKFRLFFQRYISLEDQYEILNGVKIKTPQDNHLRPIKDIDEFTKFILTLRNRYIHNGEILDTFIDEMKRGSAKSMGFLGSGSFTQTVDGVLYNIIISYEEFELIMKRGFINYYYKLI